jgi:nucleoside-diphosphate-sugar epimerase
MHQDTQMPETLRELAAGLTGRRVLITGGLGFLGSSLARVLVEAGVEVRIIDALIAGQGGLRSNLAGIEDDVEIHIGDVRDAGLTRRLVEGRDVIFSFAGQTSHLDSMVDPYADLEHNCRGPLTVLEAARRVAPEAVVVFAGTRQIYGRPDYLPVDEQHPIRPVDVNGIHKAAGEAYHDLYRQVYGTRVAVLRLTNTFGPRMRIRDARQTFLGLWIRLLLAGEPLDVYGDGSQQRDFTYVDDALCAFLLVAQRHEAEGTVFNLGDERAISLRQLAELLISIHGGGELRLIEFPDDRKVIDIGDYHADFGRISRALGWRPAVTLEDGLRRTLKFFSEHEPDRLRDDR